MKLYLPNDEALRTLPRLRWKQDDDGLTIATTIHRASRADHLYFHSPGILGIYYWRMSKKSATAARKMWWKRCHVPIPIGQQGPWGELEGLIHFRPEKLSDIPRQFFRGKPKGAAVWSSEQGTHGQELGHEPH